MQNQGIILSPEEIANREFLHAFYIKKSQEKEPSRCFDSAPAAYTNAKEKNAELAKALRIVYGWIWPNKALLDQKKQAYTRSIIVYAEELQKNNNEAAQLVALNQALQALNDYRKVIKDILTTHMPTLDESSVESMTTAYISNDFAHPERMPKAILNNNCLFNIFRAVMTIDSNIKERSTLQKANSNLSQKLEAGFPQQTLVGSTPEVSLLNVFDLKKSQEKLNQELLTTLNLKDPTAENLSIELVYQIFLKRFEEFEVAKEDAEKAAIRLKNSFKNIAINRFVQRLLPITSTTENIVLNELKQLSQDQLEKYIQAYIANLEPTNNHKQFNAHCQLLGILIKAAIEQGCKYENVSKLLDRLGSDRLEYLKRMDEVVLTTYIHKLAEIKKGIDGERQKLVSERTRLQSELRYVVLPIYLDALEETEQQENFEQFRLGLLPNLVEPYDCNDLKSAQTVLTKSKKVAHLDTDLKVFGNTAHSTFEEALKEANQQLTTAVISTSEENEKSQFTVQPVFYILTVSKNANLQDLQKQDLRAITKVSSEVKLKCTLNKKVVEDQYNTYNDYPPENEAIFSNEKTEKIFTAQPNQSENKIQQLQKRIQAHDKKHKKTHAEITEVIGSLKEIREKLVDESEDFFLIDRASFEEKIRSVEILIRRLNKINLEHQIDANKNPSDGINAEISAEIAAWKEHGAAKTLAHERNPFSQFYYAIAKVCGIEKDKTATEKKIDKVLSPFRRL